MADKLRAAGYDPLEASTGRDAIRLSHERNIDLVIFHSDYPDRPGVEVVRSIREHSDAPALGIYDIACREEILDLFEAGATDCTYAPMNIEECVYRAHSLLGQRPRTGPVPIRATLFGPQGVVVHEAAREVCVGEQDVELTRTEFDLLVDLLRNRGSVRSADQLSLNVWGHETHQQRNYVEAHVSRARRKLRDAGAEGVIQTVRGIGYIIR